jgi:peptide subunit release factor RF-3
MASDLDGAPVFLAQSQFSLSYALERAPGISASDIKAVGKGEG